MKDFKQKAIYWHLMDTYPVRVHKAEKYFLEYAKNTPYESLVAHSLRTHCALYAHLWNYVETIASDQ